MGFLFIYCVFFFKQKTAYEMRISDWSSDVCSSDLDFHGSVGYGQEFTDAISQHRGDRPLEDLQKGWAAAQQQYDFLDGSNACALGASYGGYMVYWLAGNWHTPDSGARRCLVDHDGELVTRIMGYATEELWLTAWENGGTPYDNPEGYEKFNPINHVND